MAKALIRLTHPLSRKDCTSKGAAQASKFSFKTYGREGGRDATWHIRGSEGVIGRGFSFASTPRMGSLVKGRGRPGVLGEAQLEYGKTDSACSRHAVPAASELVTLEAMRRPSNAKRPRLLIFIVAYHAETTIRNVLSRIPEAIQEEYHTEVLVIDDASIDTHLRTQPRSPQGEAAPVYPDGPVQSRQSGLRRQSEDWLLVRHQERFRLRGPRSW